MIVTEYVIPLGENARKRHYHKTSKGKVIGFVVQLEVLVGDQWQAVIRYDCAHGFVHIDRYYLDGRKAKKELLIDVNNFFPSTTIKIPVFTSDREAKILCLRPV